jgi:hypothetical protein
MNEPVQLDELRRRSALTKLFDFLLGDPEDREGSHERVDADSCQSSRVATNDDERPEALHPPTPLCRDAHDSA